MKLTKLLLISRPREDERLSWPCWLTYSGRLTHKVTTRPASSQAQEKFAGQRPAFYHCTLLNSCLFLVSRLSIQLSGQSGGRVGRYVRPPRRSLVGVTTLRLLSCLSRAHILSVVLSLLSAFVPLLSARRIITVR